MFVCVCVFFVFFFCCDSYHARYRIFHASSYDTYILVVRCIKRNKGAVWSLVLRRDTGVRADPKYPYIYDVICIYVREECYFRFSILIFHIYLVGAW